MKDELTPALCPHTGSRPRSLGDTGSADGSTGAGTAARWPHGGKVHLSRWTLSMEGSGRCLTSQ
jgi:hypothetical protein